LALASAKRFVEEGAYVFITGRRQEALDEAVKLIGRNVTGVRGDAANLDDLDRLFDTVKSQKGKIDVLFASAGKGEAAKLGEITEHHLDTTFSLIARGTLFTVQKALPLFNDGGSIIMTGSVASVKGFPGFGVYYYRSRHDPARTASALFDHCEVVEVAEMLGTRADQSALLGEILDKYAFGTDP